MSRALVAAVFAVALAASSPAHANSFGFSCITHNDPSDCGTGEANLSMTVSGSESYAQFTFSSGALGDPEISITGVYFDLGSPSPLPMMQIMNMPGVDFLAGGSPPVLPGGNGFFSVDLAAHSTPSTYHNGVQPGEMLTIGIGLPFDQVISALNEGSFRVGLHVQGFDPDGSESFVNIVPEPSATLLFLAGTAIAAHSLRRRR